MKRHLLRAVALMLSGLFLLTACGPVIEESTQSGSENAEGSSSLAEKDPEVTVEGSEGMYTVTVDGKAISVDTKYYPGWTRKALTFSLDDGNTTFDPLLVPILNEYGIRATFMLHNGSYKDLTLYDGHEVANHSYSHSGRFMTTNANPFTVAEILQDIDKQEQNLEQLLADAKSKDTTLDLNEEMGAFAIPMTSGYFFDADGSADAADARSDADNEALAELFRSAGIQGYSARVIADLTNKEIMLLYFEAKGYVANRVIRNGSPVTYDLPESFLFWTPSARLSQMADKDGNASNGYQNDLSKNYIDLPDDGEMKLLFIWGHPTEVIHTATKEEHTGTPNSTVWKRDLISFLELFQGDEYYKGTMSEVASYANAQKKLTVNEKGKLVNPTDVDLYAIAKIGTEEVKLRIPAGKSVMLTSLASPKIAAYYGNKKAAVSITFDDGQIETGEYASEIMEQYGLRGTMFMIVDKANADQLPDEGTAEYDAWIARWNAVADAGAIDIGNHSYHHYSNILYKDGKPSTSKESYEGEIDAARDKLAAYFPNASILTFATPGGGFCETTREALIAGGYLSNRGLGDGMNDPFSKDFDIMRVSSSQIVKSTKASNINAKVDLTIQNGGWYVELIHYIDDENGNPIWDYNESIKTYSTPRAYCEEHFAYLASKKSEIWCGSYNDVAAYLIEAKYTYFTLDSFSDVRYTYTVETDTTALFRDYGIQSLPEGYDHPLTVRFAVPADWTGVRVTVDGKKRTVTPKKDGTTAYIEIDINPQSDTVELYRAN